VACAAAQVAAGLVLATGKHEVLEEQVLEEACIVDGACDGGGNFV